MTFAFNPFTGKLDRVATSGGGTPGGTGTEIQYRSSATTLGAIAGSSVDPATGNTTFSARWISSRNSAAGAPAHTLTGAWFTGGTAESTKPHFLIEPIGATSNSWRVNGTGLGVNAPNGFTGDLTWFGVNGSPKAIISSAGAVSGASFSLLLSGFDLDGNAPTLWRKTTGEFYFGTQLQSKYGYIGANISIASGGAYSWGVDSEDLFLRRDAANTLAQRNGGTSAAPVPQTFRLANYQAAAGSTDFERGYLSWASNVFRVGTEKGTTGGTARALELQTDGVTRIRIGAAGQIGVFGAAAVAQPTAIPNATDAASTQSGLNSVLAALRSLGWIAT